MNLYPLSSSPKQSAIALADIHLVPTIQFATRILNVVIHRLYGGDVDVIHCQNGEIDYSVRGIGLMPPLWRGWRGRNNSTAQWVDWAQDHHRHTWWIVTHLWFVDRERRERLGFDKHPDYKQAENWNISKLFAALPKKNDGTDMSPPEYFPLTKEVKEFVKPEKDITWAYCQLYRDRLQRVKARWTNQEVPEFVKDKYGK